jgi:hypothetical protein
LREEIYQQKVMVSTSSLSEEKSPKQYTPLVAIQQDTQDPLGRRVRTSFKGGGGVAY